MVIVINGKICAAATSTMLPSADAVFVLCVGGMRSFSNAYCTRCYCVGQDLADLFSKFRCYSPLTLSQPGQWATVTIGYPWKDYDNYEFKLPF